MDPLIQENINKALDELQEVSFKKPLIKPENKKANTKSVKIDNRYDDTFGQKTHCFSSMYDELVQSIKSISNENSLSQEKTSTTSSEIINPLKVTENENSSKIKSNEIINNASKPKESDLNQNHLNSLITICEKKAGENDEAVSQTVQSFTNTQDIKDFYEYTEECLKRYSRIKQPTQKQLDELYIEKFPFDDELKNKKLAVFDLDETLIHCESKNFSKGEVQLTVSCVKNNKKMKFKIGINIRPFLYESLAKIKDNYVIIVYTASEKPYADEVLNYLDKNNEIFAYRLYRNNCVKVNIEGEPNPIYVKDLRIFKNIDLKNIMIIDNSALSFAFHLDNGIPILPFYNNKADEELVTLVNYMNSIAKEDDLRVSNRKLLKMYKFYKKVTDIIDEGESDESLNSELNNSMLSEDQNDILMLSPCGDESPNTSFTSIDVTVNTSGYVRKTTNKAHFKNEIMKCLDEWSKLFNKK